MISNNFLITKVQIIMCMYAVLSTHDVIKKGILTTCVKVLRINPEYR